MYSTAESVWINLEIPTFFFHYESTVQLSKIEQMNSKLLKSGTVNFYNRIESHEIRSHSIVLPVLFLFKNFWNIFFTLNKMGPYKNYFPLIPMYS